MKYFRILSLPLVTVMLLAGMCIAGNGAVLFEDYFTDDISGWSSKDIDTGLDADAYSDPVGGPGGSLTHADGLSPLGGNEGAMKISGGAADASSVRDDLIYASVGPWDVAGAPPDMGFSFYYEPGEAPGQMDSYFLGNGIIWLHNFSLAGAGWQNYGTMMDFSTGWYRWDGGVENYSTFGSSLTSVTEIGIHLRYQFNQPGQVYGLDNFMVVPEPEEWALICIALISLAITYRKKLNMAVESIGKRAS